MIAALVGFGSACIIVVWVCAWAVAGAGYRANYHRGRADVYGELTAELGRLATEHAALRRLSDAHDAINVLDMGGSRASMSDGARREYDHARAEQF